MDLQGKTLSSSTWIEIPENKCDEITTIHLIKWNEWDFAKIQWAPPNNLIIEVPFYD